MLAGTLAHLLRRIAGLVVATLAAAATLSTVGAPAEAAPPPSKPGGGEAIMGLDQEPVTMNPFMPGGDAFVLSEIGQAFFCGAFDIDAGNQLIPGVLTRLPTVANGGMRVNGNGTLTVRYDIHPDAVWADGTPISGADFRFTFNTIMRPDLPTDKVVYEDIVAVSSGAKSFEFTLARPTLQARFLFGFLIPQHTVAGSDFADDWADAPWTSCGPFEFVEWKKGDRLTVARNDRFWKRDPATGQSLPLLDTVVFRFFASSNALVDAFEARQIDVFRPPPSVEVLDDLAGLEAAGADLQTRSGAIWEHLNFQFGPNRLTRNPRSLNQHLLLRQAVAHAIDKDEIVVEVQDGRVPPMDSYVEAFSSDLSQGAWAQYFHDPATARAKVTELCAQVDCGPTGRPRVVFSTTSNNDDRVRISQLIGPMLEAGGMDYVTDLEDSSLFFGESLDFGTWDVGLWAWVGGPGLAGLVAIHDVFDPDSPPPEGQNFYRWGTPAVSGRSPAGFNQGPSSVIDADTARFAELRDLMNGTVDENAVARYVAEAERILADQAVMIPLYQRLDAGMVWEDELGGFVHNVSLAGATWNLEEWYRQPTPEVAQGQVAAGGSLTTGGPPTPADPISTTVFTPNGGAVSIIERGTSPVDPPGFALAPFEVDIRAPGASSANPLRIVIGIDASLLAPGMAPAALVPTKNGVAVPDCTGAGATPDPCVAGRRALAGGDAELTILASTASLWRAGLVVPVRHDVGLVDTSQGRWYLDDGTRPFFFGDPGDFPMLGDWDCDGVETPGLYRQADGFVYLRNSNTSGIADIRFFFGDPGDIPLAGDFDGDGCDTVSIYRPGEARIFVINELGANDGGLGAADLAYVFGNPGDKPFVGDFDGDGVETVGLHRESTGLVYFRNSQTSGIADNEFIYGDPGDRLVAGDWNADGRDSPAIFRPAEARFYQRFTNTAGVANRVFDFGEGSWLPVAGDVTP